jgi:UDP-glucose 4-epimerase
MFKFFLKNNKKISRVVVLGSGGFIGKELCKVLSKQKIKTLAINRKKIDLKYKKSINKLSQILKSEDVVVFIAGVVPVKHLKMLEENIEICFNVTNALLKKNIQHLIYISSDAVYEDSKNLISEKSNTNPDSLHGTMHLFRESILKQHFQKKLCIIRPTLIYGVEDTHSGYGPNLFFKLASQNKSINLFGKGEELRDHISIYDVTQIILTVIQKRGIGIINAVSGKVVSFFFIAKNTNKNLDNKKISINYIDRNGPIPHNGYRAFDNKLLKKNFKYLNIKKFPYGFLKK